MLLNDTKINHGTYHNILHEKIKILVKKSSKTESERTRMARSKFLTYLLTGSKVNGLTRLGLTRNGSIGLDPKWAWPDPCGLGLTRAQNI